MAARLDSFGLSELTSKPEDAFRLATLAMAEGRRVPGYGGDHYYYWMGDAAAVFHVRLDPETGEEELLGMDTHARTGCGLWACVPSTTLWISPTMSCWNTASPCTPLTTAM